MSFKVKKKREGIGKPTCHTHLRMPRLFLVCNLIFCLQCSATVDMFADGNGSTLQGVAQICDGFNETPHADLSTGKQLLRSGKAGKNQLQLDGNRNETLLSSPSPLYNVSRPACTIALHFENTLLMCQHIFQGPHRPETPLPVASDDLKQESNNYFVKSLWSVKEHVSSSSETTKLLTWSMTGLEQLTAHAALGCLGPVQSMIDGVTMVRSTRTCNCIEFSCRCVCVRLPTTLLCRSETRRSWRQQPTNDLLRRCNDLWHMWRKSGSWI